MFEFLDLRDFQIFKKQHIELDKNVTTLIGSNNRGKSTILRCIEWICQNNFRGDSFIHWGAKSGSGILGVDNNVIKRIKGERNLYILNGSKFNAFGNKVPEEIAKILNTHPCSFQDQHEALYWLSQSPGAIGKSLNEIIDLDIIDRSLFNIGREVRENRVLVNIKEKELNQLKQRKKDISWVVELDNKLTTLEDIEKKLNQVKQKRVQLLQALIDLRGLTSKVAKACTTLPKVLESLKDLKKIAIIIQELKAKQNELKSRLSNWKTAGMQCQKSEEKYQKHLQQFEEAKKRLKVCPLCRRSIKVALQ